MKGFGTVLLIIFLLLGVYIVHEYFDTMSPAWQVEASAKAAMNVKDYDDQLRNAAIRRAWWTEFYQVALPGLFIVVCAGAAVYMWMQYDQRKESWARAVDGTFALQSFSNGQVRWQVDPNKQLTGTTGFQQATGLLGEFSSAAGPDRQLTYNTAIQRTRTAQAHQMGEIRNSAQAKLAAGYYDRPQRPEEYRVIEDAPAQLTVTPYRPLTLADAFAQSTADNWLLGNGIHGPCNFSVRDVVHTGLIGATRTGKTSSTALLMAMNARKHGMHVIALDGAGGVDWRPYGNMLEVHESDYTTIGDQINELVRIHDLRMKAIKFAGVPNIDELDYQMPSLFVVMEEHGRTMQSYAAASKKQYTLTESALSNLMRVSRKSGIYFLLIDQSLNGWSGEVKANVKSYIAYHLGGNQGAAFNAYDLHKLRPNGEFWHSGSVYEAWHTKAQADTLQRNLQPCKMKLLTDSQAIADGEYREVTHQPDTLTHDQGGRVNAQTTPLSGVSSGVSPTNYQSKSVSAGVSSGVSGDTSVSDECVSVSPKLTGKPVSKKDIELVRNTYALTNSARETARILWGKRNDSRVAWVKEIVSGEVQQ